MNKPQINFIDEFGTFKVEHAQLKSYLYFPLTNYNGIMSSITPNLNGDTKTSQHEFALVPVTQEDLMNSSFGRNVWFSIDSTTHVAANGNSPAQLANNDDVAVEAGFLFHKVTRKSKTYKITATSFVPYVNENIELTKYTFTNITEYDIKIVPTVATPVYGRSADLIRDHRHVTALLNRVELLENGILSKPTLSFDERGHQKNEVEYSVTVDFNNNKISQYYPTLEDFCGEGGSLLKPRSIFENLENGYKSGQIISGYEAIAAFSAEERILSPNESIEFTVMIAITPKDSKQIIGEYCRNEKFEKLLEETKVFWSYELKNLSFDIENSNKSKWLKWVTLQPILRRIYGCSFLPHHDYGRGGRGWRDLWQDCLALILMEPDKVRDLLWQNFAGCRLDGSNATIIGSKPGEFLADRNKIVRIWMDHGAWPLITTKLYLDHANDIEFLLEKQSYFRDSHTHYAKKTCSWTEIEGNKHLDSTGKIYTGTVLEHLLIQNLIPVYNVGKHNISRLEDADWNDGLDMAHTNGESVAFYSLYSDNLTVLSKLMEDLHYKGHETIELLEELLIFINNDIDSAIEDISLKNDILEEYFDSVSERISRNKTKVDTLELSNFLSNLSESIKNFIRGSEWLEDGDLGWFNGYYDDDGHRLENVIKQDMTLTGQVFPIMSGVATKQQIEKIVNSADKLLFDETKGGYRLNTNFDEVKLNMGRLFGFAYGHKENGAVFSHMAVMYSYALYKRGFAKEGKRVLDAIYNLCSDFEKSSMYPGIPEYFDTKGRGVYNYLTGSASWLILTMVDQVFGVRKDQGKLILDPKLQASEFNDGVASIKTLLNGEPCRITYVNLGNKDYGDYRVQKVLFDDKETNFNLENDICSIETKKNKKVAEIKVELS